MSLAQVIRNVRLSFHLPGMIGVHQIFDEVRSERGDSEAEFASKSETTVNESLKRSDAYII